MDQPIINVISDKQRGIMSRIQSVFPTGESSNFLIYESSLRVERQLVVGKTNYKFDLYDTGQIAGARPSQRLVNRNDCFIITHIALSIGREVSGGLQIQNYPLHTFPDPNFFSGAAVSGATEAQSLEVLYNGQLSFFTKPSERLRTFPTEQLKFTPGYPNRNGNILTQTTAADTAVTFDARYPAQWGPTHEERGFFELTNAIGIDGEQDNYFTLDITGGLTGNIDGNTNAAGTGSQGQNNWVVLRALGYEVSNGAGAFGKKYTI